MSAFFSAALTSRSVETRRLSPPFIASLKAALMLSRSTVDAPSSGAAAPCLGGYNTQVRRMTDRQAGWAEPRATAVLVLADGTLLEGFGLGATGHAVGEVCFNTAMTGYEEILTDPSYAGQIITFTFPHIGNVGTNEDDIETTTPAARGLIVRGLPTEASNYRAEQSLDSWLKSHRIVGLSGIDTRRLTRLIRNKGAPNGVIAFAPDGRLDIAALRD